MSMNSIARKPAYLTYVLFALFAGLIAVGLYIAIAARPFGLDLSEKSLMAWVASLGAWGGLGIVLLMIAHSFIPFPAEIVAFLSGEMFGLYWGTLYAWSGAMVGAVLAFGLARYLGREAVAMFMPVSAEKKLANWSVTSGANALVLARFIPLIAFNLINYAAGLTHVRWWTFIWTTGIGILPLTILFVYLGERMRGASWFEWAVMAACAFGLWAGLHLISRLVRKQR